MLIVGRDAGGAAGRGAGCAADGRGGRGAGAAAFGGGGLKTWEIKNRPGNKAHKMYQVFKMNTVNKVEDTWEARCASYSLTMSMKLVSDMVAPLIFCDIVLIRCVQFNGLKLSRSIHSFLTVAFCVHEQFKNLYGPSSRSFRCFHMYFSSRK